MPVSFPSLSVFVRSETWPLLTPFTIARSSRTAVDIVHVGLRLGGFYGQGECQPNSRFNESPQAVTAQLSGFLSHGLPTVLQKAFKIWPFEAAKPHDDVAYLECLMGLKNDLTPAAMNAFDVALWDLRAKYSGLRMWELIERPAPRAPATLFTISLDAPAMMADAAQKAFQAGKRHLKLKLGAPQGDEARLIAVRRAVPEAQLVVDANEGWRADRIAYHLDGCAAQGILMVEQPLPAAEDGFLRHLKRPVPVYADEATQGRALSELVGLYDGVNLKLDKLGGLSAALLYEKQARAYGFSIMIGCMLSTSLGAAPALIVADGADFVDLDGPLLLARDRTPALTVDKNYIFDAPHRELWG